MALATSNNSLILFNIEFEITAEKPIDDVKILEQKNIVEAEISWHGNGEFFAINFSFGSGFKCLIRDTSL